MMKNPNLSRLLSRVVVLILATTGVIPTLAADAPPRERILFNDNWAFLKGDPEGAADTLTYEKLKPWLLPTANPFVTTPPAVRPQGEAPGEAVDFVQPSFDDASWRKLSLPHDWGIEGGFDQSLPGETAKLPWFGVGWYRKHIILNADDLARRCYLNIDGAMSYAAVWCNGKFAGGWPSGYASWQLDITPYLKSGGNVIAIRLDNP